jgi:Na+-transporting methylmalonyl-CoA/oxaloacetate decarboxylase beta subunit
MTKILAFLNIAAAVGILLTVNFSLPENVSIGIIGGTDDHISIFSALYFVVLIWGDTIFSALVVILLVANTVVLFRTKGRQS